MSKETLESTLVQLRKKEYELRIKADRLRREVYQQPDPSASTELLEELAKAENELRSAEEKRSAAQARDRTGGQILDTTAAEQEVTVRGLTTTGLEARLFLKMAHVPTAIYHLLNVEISPLITCEVKAGGEQTVGGGASKRRVRVVSYIEGYSAKAINTAEIPSGKTHTFKQLPTLFPSAIRDLTELTRAMLNVQVDDLDGAVEIHETQPIWLLARTAAPLAIMDPQTGSWVDLKRFLGAFVTPNAPSLMKFLRIAADYHPDRRLVGYQGSLEGVKPQVKALFDALKNNAEITYVNSLIDFNPQQGFSSQRVRLPRESLADREANCIDGTVLFASLLEGISTNPAIVLVPGHAFLAWETWKDSNKWEYVETTMIGSSTFEQACASGEKTATTYKSQKQLLQLSLTELRSKYGITPME